MKQSHHFIATTWQSRECSSMVANFVAQPPGPAVVISGVNTNSTSFIVPDSLEVELEPYAEAVRRWSQAFEPLFQRTCQVETIASKDYVRSALLKVHAISMGILLAGIRFTEETAYDVFLPQFEEMLALIATIASYYHKHQCEGNASRESGLVLSLGITPPLYLLVMRCRDRTVRWQGIEILRAWHAEACWHPVLIAQIDEFVVDVQEQDVRDAIIPEWSRAVISRVCEASDVRDGRQKALIHCMKRRGGPNGEPVWFERMVYWS